jgi:hypothetical protein
MYGCLGSNGPAKLFFKVLFNIMMGPTEKSILFINKYLFVFSEELFHGFPVKLKEHQTNLNIISMRRYLN